MSDVEAQPKSRRAWEGRRMKQAIRAQGVAPMDSPIIRDGAVAFIDGRIISVGPFSQIKSAHPDAHFHDLGDSIVLPGLINAHTHLELSDYHAESPAGGSFVDWILSMRQRSGGGDPASATLKGIEQCLKFGVTCVGDITQQADITREVISRSPIRCVSFGEVLGLGKRRPRFDELLRHALDAKYATDRLRIGLSPHAPYTVDLDGYRQCLDLARQHSLPLATHLAENPQEAQFLESQTGDFRQLWETIGSWADDVQTYPGSPIEMAKAIGLLDYPTVLAHINYCTDPELDLLSRGQASVVYCPRTHAYFGHPPHRWQEMLARGINVAVGTDSCASSPDLNLVDDLRLLHRIAPEVSVQELWELATTRAAKALGMESEIGSISMGKRADFAVFKAESGEPLQKILESSQTPKATWINGMLA